MDLKKVGTILVLSMELIFQDVVLVLGFFVFLFFLMNVCLALKCYNYLFNFLLEWAQLIGLPDI